MMIKKSCLYWKQIAVAYKKKKLQIVERQRQSEWQEDERLMIMKMINQYGS